MYIIKYMIYNVLYIYNNNKIEIRCLFGSNKILKYFFVVVQFGVLVIYIIKGLGQKWNEG